MDREVCNLANEVKCCWGKYFKFVVSNVNFQNCVVAVNGKKKIPALLFYRYLCVNRYLFLPWLLLCKLWESCNGSQCFSLYHPVTLLNWSVQTLTLWNTTELWNSPTFVKIRPDLLVSFKHSWKLTCGIHISCARMSLVVYSCAKPALSMQFYWSAVWITSPIIFSKLNRCCKHVTVCN